MPDSINSGKTKRKISKATFLIASDHIYTICSYNNEVLLLLFKIISEIIILMIVNNWRIWWNVKKYVWPVLRTLLHFSKKNIYKSFMDFIFNVRPVFSASYFIFSRFLHVCICSWDKELCEILIIEFSIWLVMVLLEVKLGTIIYIYI